MNIMNNKCKSINDIICESCHVKTSLMTFFVVPGEILGASNPAFFFAKGHFIVPRLNEA